MGTRTEPTVTLSILHLLETYWFAILTGVVILRYASRRYLSPLRSIPGPPWASFTRAWKVYHGIEGDIHRAQQEMHKKYGPIVRIAPNEISFATPTAAKEIYSVSKGFNKTPAYSIFPPPENPDIFTEANEAKHAVKRRMASAAYSMKTIMELEDEIDKVERSLFERLDELYVDKAECDLGAWVEFFAFDVIGKIVFSKDFGFMATGTDREGAIKYIEDMFTWYTTWSFMPEYHKLIRGDWVIAIIMRRQSLLTEMALREMGDRVSSTEKQLVKKDLLGRFLEAVENNPDKLTHKDVFSIAHGALAAGSDSTAASTRAIIFFLLKHPSAYTKLVAEIDRKDRAGELSPQVTYAEAQKMPYLQAVMKESMRLYPAVGIPMPRYVPEGGAEIDGQRYAAGTVVGITAWVVHLDREVFGEDADIFRPERWLEGDTKVMERTMYQFGGGSHICIGKNISMMEMSRLIPQLFRTYHIRLVDQNCVLKENCQFFVRQKGLKVNLKKR